MRWGLGPVFIYECLANSRRWQTFALRSAGVAALLFAMGTIAWSRTAATTGSSARVYADLGESYFYAMIGVELALVMLAAPARESRRSVLAPAGEPTRAPETTTR